MSAVVLCAPLRRYSDQEIQAMPGIRWRHRVVRYREPNVFLPVSVRLHISIDRMICPRVDGKAKIVSFIQCGLSERQAQMLLDWLRAQKMRQLAICRVVGNDELNEKQRKLTELGLSAMALFLKENKQLLLGLYRAMVLAKNHVVSPEEEAAITRYWELVSNPEFGAQIHFAAKNRLVQFVVNVFTQACQIQCVALDQLTRDGVKAQVLEVSEKITAVFNAEFGKWVELKQHLISDTDEMIVDFHLLQMQLMGISLCRYILNKQMKPLVQAYEQRRRLFLLQQMNHLLAGRILTEQTFVNLEQLLKSYLYRGDQFSQKVEQDLANTRKVLTYVDGVVAATQQSLNEDSFENLLPKYTAFDRAILIDILAIKRVMRSEGTIFRATRELRLGGNQMTAGYLRQQMVQKLQEASLRFGSIVPKPSNGNS